MAETVRQSCSRKNERFKKERSVVVDGWKKIVKGGNRSGEVKDRGRLNRRDTPRETTNDRTSCINSPGSIKAWKGFR